MTNEDKILAALKDCIEIDEEGRIWRVAIRYRWPFTSRRRPAKIIPCARERVEWTDKDGELRVSVSFDGAPYTATAARVVWRHFNGPIPRGKQVTHVDGDPTNNRRSNLRLTSQAECARAAVARRVAAFNAQTEAAATISARE